MRFRGALASNHISYFTKKTLELTVESAGWKIQDSRSFFFSYAFFDKLLNIISPKIYIIAKNEINFKYPDKLLAQWQDDDYYRFLFKTTKQI